MDDNLEDKKYFNNNILIESKNIRKGAKNFVSTKRKNRCTNKFYSYLNGDEQNQQNEIYSVTENKNKFQEFKENIFYNDGLNNRINDVPNKNKKFIRLKKGIHLRKKNKTSRNIKNNFKNNLFYSHNYGKNGNNFFEELVPKHEARKSEILSHSYSLDNYLNLSSNFLCKFKSPLENSQLFDKNFVKNIKNKKRKSDLINAIEKYKKFKTLITNKSDKRLQTCNLNETDNDSESESIGKRLDQINRIKIQNIINFEKVYENIKKMKKLDKYNDENKKKKKEYNQEKNSKKIFVRQLLREEKYTIGEDGKEKILEINHSILSNKLNININEGSNAIDVEENNNNQEKNEKLKNRNQRIVINNKNTLKTNNKNNNLFLQKRRSEQNFNNNLKTFINNNKIFIKKHPSKAKINISPKLNNKRITNKEIVKRRQLSDYNILDNNFKNHSYREIKNLNNVEEINKCQNNFKYNKKKLNTNFGNNIIKRNKLQSNNNFFSRNDYKNNYYPNNKQIIFEKNKNKFHSNRSYDSKGISKNNSLYEIANKERQNNVGSRQFIMFNLNNQNNLEQNKNNNFIIINASKF